MSRPFGPVPLTPLDFLQRSAHVHAARPAVVDGSRTMSYEELAASCRSIAAGLLARGLEPGDRVSVLAPNTLEMLALHFAVPGAGLVLNTLNTRLSVAELAAIVEHAGSRLLVVDECFAAVGAEIAARVDRVDLVICGENVGDALLSVGGEGVVLGIEDELALLAINYTSGTTGRPKGVMYDHRGAYLQSLSMLHHLDLGPESVFLWTLPMFHCNGWCFPWAVTAAGGLHVCLDRVDGDLIWEAVRKHGVTNFNAAPTVLSMLVATAQGPAPRPVRVATGGAPPSPALLAELADLQIHVTHLYGLTETYGPAAICEWKQEWNELGGEDRSRLLARQGVGGIVSQPLRVLDDRGDDVPSDGVRVGEVALRGNNVMVGYYREPESTADVARDGWLRTGDLAVMHPDGYVELVDRAKDIIISGGENIASIEVEQALAAHPDVLECAVVAGPDERWGEVPVAFVELRPGAEFDEAALVAHVKGRIARFKAPRRIVQAELPRTATGKIQKNVLRDHLRVAGG